MSEGTAKSGSPPNGYHPLPAGNACKCIHVWQDGKGNYWCCRPTPFFTESAGDRITGVAIVDAQGRLWALPAPRRHHHIFALAAFMGEDAEGSMRGQGFVTSANRFVERADALEIAKAAGQTRPGAALGHQLYSEDLW